LAGLSLSPPEIFGSASRFSGQRERASVLIIVLWVAFGLVSLAIYFANSSSLELRAADNRVAALEAEQAIAGAARYVSNALANVTAPGTASTRKVVGSGGVPGAVTFASALLT